MIPSAVIQVNESHAAFGQAPGQQAIGGVTAIGAFGSKVNETPNLDRLAAEGMRFDNAFCTNSLCAPSRAVILTGKHSHRNGVLSNREILEEMTGLPCLGEFRPGRIHTRPQLTLDAAHFAAQDFDWLAFRERFWKITESEAS